MLRPYQGYGATHDNLHRIRTEMNELHGSAGGILAPLEIVGEGPAGLDAPFAGRFAWPFPFRTRERKWPVCDCVFLATCSGVPVAIILPPRSPPSGPRSISQSADLMTSRLCSITRSDAPPSSSLRNALRSFAMSSKCNPVVGSSRMYSTPSLSV